MKQQSKKQLGIYVHIPFCIQKCVYCDFLSGPANEETKENYVRALIREIAQTVSIHGNTFVDYQVQSVFFGGGTPSAIKAELIAKVMSELFHHFDFAEDAEISLECNPGTLTREKATIYKVSGINRISFGLQSANNQELKMLGRIHTWEQFQQSMQIAREVGFDNINVDLMSALPGQTISSYHETLNQVLNMNPEHISAYSLILEEGTPLFDTYETEYPPLPDEDAEREMYYLTQRSLLQQGYEHYEISNFAKKGYECKHNLSYWERKDYLGFGIGAASLFQESRYSNIEDMSQYISHTNLNEIRMDVHHLSKEEQMEEFMFLGLRKVIGVDEEVFFKQFQETLSDVYGSVIHKNEVIGMLKYTGHCLSLTDRGRDVSNVILADFLLA